MICLFLMILFSLNAQATPQKIQMIFLSPGKVSMLLELIDKNQSAKALTLLSQNDQSYVDNCIPMGEGCFHPQYGYIDRKPILKSQPTLSPDKVLDPQAITPAIAMPNDPELQLKTFNAVETSMINCDKGNYFDIYCGKEKAQAKPSEIEIWFDVSSSLRSVDYNKDPNFCNRRTFYTKIMEGCKDKVSVSIYNTSLKQVGEASSVCLSYGTNDEAKLLQWMKDSQAKLLVLVTDIDEVSSAMRSFLSENKAKTIGDGAKAFTSAELENYANDFVKSCKK